MVKIYKNRNFSCRKSIKSECFMVKIFPKKPTVSGHRRRFQGTLHVEVGFEVTALRSNAQLLVAASRRSNELRLFQRARGEDFSINGG